MANLPSPPTYEQALALIADHTATVGKEFVSLDDGWQRVTAAEVRAASPEPGYDQSLRDGFVIGKSNQGVISGRCSYQLIGEIPAGRCDLIELRPGEAYRIMTGGMVPAASERVVQQEDCFYTGNTVEVPTTALSLQSHYIQRKGSFIPQSSQVVARGTSLGPREIGLLATTGNHRIEVHRKVSVSFFCTGNELVSIHDSIAPGQKVSSNRYLLNTLIKGQQAIPVDCGVARDNEQKVRELLFEIGRSSTDIIISTGGMGPGKYDLLETLFEEIGGKIIYRSIAMRPGQSTLFGILAGKLYFGLPGPPSAVAVLFKELVLPSLKKMQGQSEYLNRDIKAVLDHDISYGIFSGLLIRQGVLFSRGHVNHVRQVDKREFSNCSIFLREGHSHYQKGDILTVHKL